MSDEKRKWWQSPHFPVRQRTEIDSSSAITPMFWDAIAGGPPVEMTSVSGFPMAGSEKIKDLLQELGGRVVYSALSSRKEGYYMYYTWDDSFAILDVSFAKWNTYLIVTAGGTNPERIKTIVQSVKPYVGKAEKKGKVYVLSQEDNGIVTRELSMAAEKFEPNNYDPKVVEDFNHIISDIKSDTPCGRLVILDGEPGTGKSYMVRALLHESPDAQFILIPADLISSLGGPGLISPLLNLRAERDGGPIIFVIEDADICLVNRAADNLSSISALLNFGDGIMGSALNLRVVCTTNASMDQMDEAIVRSGRLCRRVEIGKIDEVQANSIYQRLTGSTDKPFKRGSYKLADVYKTAKEGEEITRKTERKAGFAI